jgi:rSAM/selenodomain-associated transferase 2
MIRETDTAPRQMLTIIIPTLNAAAVLRETLAGIGAGAPPREIPESLGIEIPEIIVVDGGSTDETRAIATAASAIVVDAPRGRGQQLAAGAQAASGDWLLFLHADTRLAGHWAEAAASFMADPGNQRRAGYFRFVLDDAAPAARRIEAAVRWRNRVLGLPYGDQGLLIGRALYDALGGYRRIPLMEDVNLARRIGRRRLVMLGAETVTSAERYRREGYVRRPLRNTLCLGLYSIGVPARFIASIYR